MRQFPPLPLRYAPGLSLSNSVEPPPQLGVFTDGGGLSPITAFHGGLQPLRYLDYTSAALPYHLLERPEALIIGAGGGPDVLLALYHRAARIDAVELNPQLVRLVRDIFADFAGHLYDRPDVRVRLSEGRGFVAGAWRHYYVIQLPLLDSFAAAAAGLLPFNLRQIWPFGEPPPIGAIARRGAVPGRFSRRSGPRPAA